MPTKTERKDILVIRNVQYNYHMKDHTQNNRFIIYKSSKARVQYPHGVAFWSSVYHISFILSFILCVLAMYLALAMTMNFVAVFWSVVLIRLWNRLPNKFLDEDAWWNKLGRVICVRQVTQLCGCFQHHQRMIVKRIMKIWKLKSQSNYHVTGTWC